MPPGISRRGFLRSTGLVIGGAALSTAFRSNVTRAQATEEYFPPYDFQLSIGPNFDATQLFVSDTPLGSIPLEDLTARYLQNRQAFPFLETWCDTCDVDFSVADQSVITPQFQNKIFLPFASGGMTQPTSDNQQDLFAGMPDLLQPVVQHPLDNFRILDGGDYEYNMGVLFQEVGIPPLDNILIPEGISIPQHVIEGYSQAQTRSGWQVGSYYIRLQAHQGTISCFDNRRVWHANFEVQKLRWTGNRWTKDYTVFNIHLGAWWRGKTPCFGIYESRRRWCRTRCLYPNWNLIYSLALAILVTAVAYWIAVSMASIIAASGLALLIAIPGVPPPP